MTQPQDHLAGEPAAPDYGFDPTSLSGYSNYLGDQKKASEAIAGLNSPAGNGRSPWEAGLIGADTGYQSSVKGLQDQYGAMSGYLDTLGAAGQSGYQQGYASRQYPWPTPPAEASNQPGAPYQPAANPGPTQKPEQPHRGPGPHSGSPWDQEQP